MIRIKRVYDPPVRSDGKRILVDRLWPRGLTKEKARIDYWAKDVAPSNALRTWYRHEPAKWAEFRRRFRGELDRNRDAVRALLAEIDSRTVTLVFGSKEQTLNNAVALKEYIETLDSTHRSHHTSRE